MTDYLTSIKKEFEYYKMLGEKTFEQIPEEKLFWQPNEESNSIAMIVKHLHGNMLSRWTDFMTTECEKEWRKRDEEWNSLSIPKGKSKEFNKEKFSKPKRKEYFTDDL